LLSQLLEHVLPSHCPNMCNKGYHNSQHQLGYLLKSRKPCQGKHMPMHDQSPPTSQLYSTWYKTTSLARTYVIAPKLDSNKSTMRRPHFVSATKKRNGCITKDQRFPRPIKVFCYSFWYSTGGFGMVIIRALFYIIDALEKRVSQKFVQSVSVDTLI